MAVLKCLYMTHYNGRERDAQYHVVECVDIDTGRQVKRIVTENEFYQLWDENRDSQDHSYSEEYYWLFNREME